MTTAASISEDTTEASPADAPVMGEEITSQSSCVETSEPSDQAQTVAASEAVSAMDNTENISAGPIDVESATENTTENTEQTEEQAEEVVGEPGVDKIPAVTAPDETVNQTQEDAEESARPPEFDSEQSTETASSQTAVVAEISSEDDADSKDLQ